MNLEQAREARLDRDLDTMITEKINGNEAYLGPPISQHAKIKLRGILKKYARSAHPFRECVRDNMKRFGPGRTEAVCGTLKATIKGFGKKVAASEDADIDDLVVDADVLLALDAISEFDLGEIFLEARAFDEYKTTEGVALLNVDARSELERWGTGAALELAQATAAKRSSLKPEDFALPPDGYPMHDRAHAVNALARAKQHATPQDYATIKARVCKRYSDLPACKEGS